MASSCCLSLADLVPGQGSLSVPLGRLPSMELPHCRALLYGPERCGKTSLLFQCACHLASSGKHVVILCDQAGLDQAPPLLPPGADASSAALQRISFKFVRDLQQLKAYGACLHLLDTLPDAILVDGLSALAKSSRLPDKRAQDTAVTKALALLADGLAQAKEQRGADVLLLVCDSAGRDGALHNQYLLQRWFPLNFAVTGPDAGGQLTLQVAPHSKQLVAPAAARAAVHFKLTQSYVHLEQVHTGFAV